MLEAIEAGLDDLFDLDQLGLASDQILINRSTGDAHLLAFPWQLRIPGLLEDEEGLICKRSRQRQQVSRLFQDIDQAYKLRLDIEPLVDHLLAFDFPALYARLENPKPQDLDSEKIARPVKTPWLWIGLHALLLSGFIFAIVKRDPASLRSKDLELGWPDWFVQLDTALILLGALILLVFDLRQLAPDDFASFKRTLSRGLAECPARMKRISQSLIDVMRSRLELDNRTKKVRPTLDPDGLTELMIPDRTVYRLGLLSAGKPGTPEEMEGVRAYILVDEFMVGRDELSCDLILPGTSIGRRHARISRREGTFFVMDLGSKNGTSLDGRRLNKMEDYALPDRCQLCFADQAFYFCAD